MSSSDGGLGRDRGLDMSLCTIIGSAMHCPIVIRGFSDDAGSWKTKPNRWRSGRSWRSLSPAMFVA